MDKKVIVKLENISKKFDNTIVISDVSLDIYEGEFLTLLGSSGCGKTTILRMIAGLETVTSGKIYIEDEDVTNVSATKRQVNTIFQNFALFPKMTAKENIAFGLKMKNESKEVIEKKCKDAIKLVKLEGFEDRYPSDLSGGQQQRVAIARGIVMNPKVLLLDESLCSLDLKLKKSMQIELKRIQKKLGITFIYVTHNQEEALSMSDRIVIINKGKIIQEGTPVEIYRHPKSIYAADFIGEANILEATVISKDKKGIKISFLDKIKLELKSFTEFEVGEKIKIVIRPEDVKLSKKEFNNSVKGIITDSTYMGEDTRFIVNIFDEFNVKVSTSENIFSDGEEIYISFLPESITPLRN